MEVHLIDGTYELFRHYYALPSARDADGREVAAVRGVVGSVLGHDQRRRDARRRRHRSRHRVVPQPALARLQDRRGIDPELLAQFPLLEEALAALGVAVWPMVEFEADDALAAAAERGGRDPRVERVIICTPDKDLAQCVRGTRVVQMDRRDADDPRRSRRRSRSSACRRRRFPTTSRWSATRRTAIPGLPGWGAKSAAAVLARFGHLEAIPEDWRTWGVNAAEPGALARTLARERERAFLFRDARDAAHRRRGFRVGRRVAMEGPTPAFAPLAARLDRAAAAAAAASKISGKPSQRVSRVSRTPET